MSTATERCPECTSRLEPRTNGFGGCYLECSCGYVEPITRRSPSDVPKPHVKQGMLRPRTLMSPEQGLQALRDYAATLGRTPRAREVGLIRSPCPSHDWYRKTFGALRDAIVLAGLTPSTTGNPTGKNRASGNAGEVPAARAPSGSSHFGRIVEES